MSCRSEGCDSCNILQEGDEGGHMRTRELGIGCDVGSMVVGSGLGGEGYSIHFSKVRDSF